VIPIIKEAKTPSLKDAPKLPRTSILLFFRVIGGGYAAAGAGRARTKRKTTFGGGGFRRPELISNPGKIPRADGHEIRAKIPD
jgi:hypothetical protein